MTANSKELAVIGRTLDAVARVARRTGVAEIAALSVSRPSSVARISPVGPRPLRRSVGGRRDAGAKLAMARRAIIRNAPLEVTRCALAVTWRGLRLGIQRLVALRTIGCLGVVRLVREDQIEDSALAPHDVIGVPGADRRLVGIRRSSRRFAVAREARSGPRHRRYLASLGVVVTRIARDAVSQVRGVGERRDVRRATPIHDAAPAEEHRESDEHDGDRSVGDDALARQNHILSPVITVWYSVIESRSYW